VAFLLLFQAFLELLDQLVQAAEGLDLRALFIGQRTLELLAQPVFGDQRLQVVVEFFQAVEVGAEGPVELVEMRSSFTRIARASSRTRPCRRRSRAVSGR
jgi:hypothetical protein